jgi:hypothetical protein
VLSLYASGRTTGMNCFYLLVQFDWCFAYAALLIIENYCPCN